MLNVVNSVNKWERSFYGSCCRDVTIHWLEWDERKATKNDSQIKCPIQMVGSMTTTRRWKSDQIFYGNGTIIGGMWSYWISGQFVERIGERSIGHISFDYNDKDCVWKFLWDLGILFVETLSRATWKKNGSEKLGIKLVNVNYLTYLSELTIDYRTETRPHKKREKWLRRFYVLAKTIII